MRQKAVKLKRQQERDARKEAAKERKEEAAERKLIEAIKVGTLCFEREEAD